MRLPSPKVQPVRWVLGLPALVVAVGYVIARISPFSWVLLAGLLLTPFARRTFLANPRVWEWASALYLPFFWWDVWVLSRHMGIALTHLLTFLILARTWTPETPRTVGQRLGLAFALWVVVGAANNDAYYMSVSLAALVAFLWAWMAFQVWQDGAPDEPVHRLGPLAAGMTLGVAGLGFLIFLILPRHNLGLLYTDQQVVLRGEGLPGLSDRIDLGSITRLKQDAGVAFRAYLEPRSMAPESLYWRGLVLDAFDGRQWRASDGGRLHPIHRTPAGRWGLEIPASLDGNALVIEQEIWPAGDEPALLHLFQPRFVSVPSRFALRVAQGLSFPTPEVRSYTVRSVWTQRPPGRYAIRPDPWGPGSDGSAPRWRRLPPFVSPVVHRLAVQWTRGAASGIEKAQAIEQTFHRAFRYTTADPAGGSTDPIEAFLSRHRAGYCEYFASAMVLMLRSLDVPARVVVGYHGGQWNAQGEFLEVLHRDAHAWVEVWDETAGLWVGFDPTPPAEAFRNAWAGWLRRLREWQSAVAFWWDRQVVLYSARDQWELGRRLVRGLAAWGNRFGTWIGDRFRVGRFPKGAAGVLGLALVGALGAVGLWRFGVAGWVRLRRRSAPWHAYYALLKRAERWVGVRPASETPMAYVRRLQAHCPEVYPALQEATRVFYDLRFYRASPGGVRRLRTIVQTCMRRLRGRALRQ